MFYTRDLRDQFMYETRREANAAIFTVNREYTMGGLNNKLSPIFNAPDSWVDSRNNTTTSAVIFFNIINLSKSASNDDDFDLCFK